MLIDGNNVGIASHFAGEDLVDPLYRPSGAIFGMLRSIRPILAKVQADGGPGSRSSVIVAWDSGTNWRTQFYPEYKASRREPDPEKEKRMERYFDQLPRLRALLPLVGIGQVKADGYEADDVAGWLTHTCPDKQFVLVTNDKDWLQLVAHNVHVWRPMKEVLVTPANFTEQTGADDPGQYTQMMGLTGDDGDDVPGAPGIGQGFALKYLRGQLTKGKKYDAIKAWTDDENGYERSLKLVDLRQMEIPADQVAMSPGRFNRLTLMNECLALGFNSIVQIYDRWVEPFEQAATS